MHDGKLSCFDATNDLQMSQDGEMNNREEPEEKCQDMQKQEERIERVEETGGRFQFNPLIPHKSHGHPANAGLQPPELLFWSQFPSFT